MLRNRGLTGVVVALLLTTAGSFAAPAALARATGNCHAQPALRVNWNGCDLANAKLNNDLLAYASLVGTDLHNASLYGASLNYANLTHANLAVSVRHTSLTPPSTTRTSQAPSSATPSSITPTFMGPT